MSKRKSEDERKNKDFVQFYNPYLYALCDLGCSNTSAFKLYMFFIKNMGLYNEISVSAKTLAMLMEVSERTIQRSVKYLYENGFIDKKKFHCTNFYIVNPQIAWKTYAKTKEYCMFENYRPMKGEEKNEFLKNANLNLCVKIFDEDEVKRYKRGETGDANL